MYVCPVVPTLVIPSKAFGRPFHNEVALGYPFSRRYEDITVKSFICFNFKCSSRASNRKIALKILIGTSSDPRTNIY